MKKKIRRKQYFPIPVPGVSERCDTRRCNFKVIPLASSKPEAKCMGLWAVHHFLY